jgi:hydrogenase expression/formation protein HypC
MCLAIPGQIKERFEHNELPMGRVDFSGMARDVCLAYVPDAKVGDYVIVHVGFALSIVDAAEAQRTLRLLDELSGIDDADPEAEVGS